MQDVHHIEVCYIMDFLKVVQLVTDFSRTYQNGTDKWKENQRETVFSFNQGLERHSRDPGFDRNIVRDSGKRNIS